MTQVPQPPGWVAPLAESDDPDDLFDEDGRIKGSPANAENDAEDDD